MGRKIIDHTGKRYLNITVIAAATDLRTKRIYWSYLCDCGKTGRAISGSVQKKECCSSCAKLNQKQKVTKHGQAREKQRTSLYNTWLSMKQRCANPKNTSYPDYGGRGIKVCERWLNFENFCLDVGAKPSPAHQIDRIDNCGDYEPSNVRWATPVENSNNRRSSKLVTHMGITMPLKGWAAHTGIPYTALKQRLNKGWSAQDALSTPLIPRNQRRMFNLNQLPF